MSKRRVCVLAAINGHGAITVLVLVMLQGDPQSRLTPAILGACLSELYRLQSLAYHNSEQILMHDVVRMLFGICTSFSDNVLGYLFKAAIHDASYSPLL